MIRQHEKIFAFVHEQRICFVKNELTLNKRAESENKLDIILLQNTVF